MVHDWLVRDLNGPPIEYTRAYADLMFAFTFARLGATDEAKGLLQTATDALNVSANRAHGWLLGMFRFRIEDSLAGRSAIRPFPAELLPLSRGPHFDMHLARETYAVQTLQDCSRILDPFGLVDKYESVITTRPLGPQVSRLRATDTASLALEIRAVLDQAEQLPPHDRADVWSRVLPFAALTDAPFLTRLLFEVPAVIDGVLAVPPSKKHTHHAAVELAAHAIDRAAALPDSELFPPLLQAAIRLATGAKTPEASCGNLIRLGWPCLWWFRGLKSPDDALTFLHETRDQWPAHSALPEQNRRNGDLVVTQLRAMVVESRTLAIRWSPGAGRGAVERRL